MLQWIQHKLRISHLTPALLKQDSAVSSSGPSSYSSTPFSAVLARFLMQQGGKLE